MGDRTAHPIVISVLKSCDGAGDNERTRSIADPDAGKPFVAADVCTLPADARALLAAKRGIGADARLSGDEKPGEADDGSD
jgi:hypothetical protein